MILSADELPSYLATPPASAVSPPVQTLKDKLPYSELRWEDFERLSLRLARAESDVQFAQPYGTRGQEQAGIDLYARLSTGAYRVYQCKNESDFGPAKIEAAVARFLEGEWAGTATQLFLCTREGLSSRQRAAEVERQNNLLSKNGISLI